MKKLLTISVMMLALISFAGSAFATEDTFSAQELTIGTNDGVTADLVIGLSPKVSARYINPGGSDSTAQWYSIATAHAGGSTIYATAQDLNNIYTKNFTTGTAVVKTLLNIPGTATSASDWSTNGWKM